jgi:hypothetical protein
METTAGSLTSDAPRRRWYRLSDVRIWIRLAFSFGVLLLLLVLAVASGLSGLDTMFHAADASFREDVQLAQHASQIGRLVLDERRNRERNGMRPMSA